MKKFQACLVGSLCLVAAAVANADVRISTHPGTECVPLNDAASNLFYGSNGTGYNDATSEKLVVCSANKMYMHDNSDDLLVDDSYWWAYVEDNNSSANITCFLRSCTQNHSSCISSVSRSSSGTGTQGLDTTGTVFAAGSYTNHVVLRCSLPAKVGSSRSGVHGFTTYEF